MSRRKTKWSRTWQYKRILECLDAYWLSCPNEEYVQVGMYFRKANGEEQIKNIVWKNPDYVNKSADLKPAIRKLSDVECTYNGDVMILVKARHDQKNSEGSTT